MLFVPVLSRQAWLGGFAPSLPHIISFTGDLMRGYIEWIVYFLMASLAVIFAGMLVRSSL